jgi:hypothetical protein
MPKVAGIATRVALQTYIAKNNIIMMIILMEDWRVPGVDGI